jgi:hypothetical protein
MAYNDPTNAGDSPYRIGINNVGSYQVSGLPYITGSSALAKGQEAKYVFPKITKSITVINGSAQDIRVHFASTGSDTGASGVMTGSHFVLFDSKEDSYTFNVKAGEIYVSAPHANGSDNASFTIVAELTLIDVPSSFILSGSGISSFPGG